MRRSNDWHQGLALVGARYAAIGVLALLLGIAACEARVDVADAADGSDEHWRAVSAYVEMDAVWHDSVLKDKGPHPDITLAVAAARAILADETHPRRAAAAEFLIEHPLGLSSTASEDIALGTEALAAHVGADWAVVEVYHERRDKWQRRGRELDETATTDEDRSKRREAWQADEPKVIRAVVAAAAVADTESHPSRREAAEFLVLNAWHLSDGGRLAYRGARILLDHFPSYDGWNDALAALDSPVPDGRSDELWERISATAADPVVRATARYYLAARLARTANEFSASKAERKDRQARALATATGLSAGVEQEELHAQTRGANGGPVHATFAQAETELIYRIKHATAGGTLPAATGTRLDGVEEGLADYADKVLLIDFWATWCNPCIRALPKLRELVATLPADRFALLGVSVDEELTTVTEFQQDEPMPWPNWHVGDDSELARVWDVRLFPTYILVDGEGEILVRTNHLSAPFVTLIEEAVTAQAEGGSSPAT